MKYVGAIVCDLDGTLFNHQHKVSKRNAAAIAKASQAGYAIIIATGRSINCNLPTAAELGCPELFFVGCNGAVVYKLRPDSCEAAETYFETQLTTATIDKIASGLGKGRAQKADVGSKSYFSISIPVVAPQLTMLEMHNKIESTKPTRLTDYAAELKKLPAAPNKMTVFDEDAKALAAAAKTLGRLDGSIELVAGGPNWVDTVNTAHDKAGGVRLLCEKVFNHLPLSACIAFGDGANDASMLAECGVGVAMGQGRDEAKRAANYVSRYTNEQDAVGREIEALLTPGGAGGGGGGSGGGIVSGALSFAFAPIRSLFRLTLPMGLCPPDVARGVAPTLAPAQIAASVAHKRALVVGGTKGIGRAIATVLRACGASVTVVGRSAAEAEGGIAADLSTVAGCKELVKALEQRKNKATTTTRSSTKKKSGGGGGGYDFVIMTVGVWPSRGKAAFTSDGLHTVVQLDLIARHVVLTGLVEGRLLEEDCRIMSVLASGQAVPSSIIDEASLKQRLASGSDTLVGGFSTMLHTAVAHDAWLRHLSRNGGPLSKFACITTFPGLLVSDLPSSSFPLWMMPLLKAGLATVADDEWVMGINHCSILLSRQAGADITGGVKDGPCASMFSAWAAPLREARQVHELARDDAIGLWVYEFVEREVYRAGGSVM